LFQSILKRSEGDVWASRLLSFWTNACSCIQRRTQCFLNTLPWPVYSCLDKIQCFLNTLPWPVYSRIDKIQCFLNTLPWPVYSCIDKIQCFLKTLPWPVYSCIDKIQSSRFYSFWRKTLRIPPPSLTWGWKEILHLKSNAFVNKIWWAEIRSSDNKNSGLLLCISRLGWFLSMVKAYWIKNKKKI
jgi:hypothetical protein